MSLKHYGIRWLTPWSAVRSPQCPPSLRAGIAYSTQAAAANDVRTKVQPATSTMRCTVIAYDPNGLVDGDTTKLGCHTENEESPWARIDLGSSKSIHHVVVTNRLDGLAASAVPLLVEVSSDGENFEEFARQDSGFKTWTATGSRTKARYVRVRVTRLSTLHLNEVESY